MSCCVGSVRGLTMKTSSSSGTIGTSSSIVRVMTWSQRCIESFESADSVHSRSIVQMSNEFCGASLPLATGRMNVVLHRSITFRSFCSLQ